VGGRGRGVVGCGFLVACGGCLCVWGGGHVWDACSVPLSRLDVCTVQKARMYMCADVQHPPIPPHPTPPLSLSLCVCAYTHTRARPSYLASLHEGFVLVRHDGGRARVREEGAGAGLEEVLALWGRKEAAEGRDDLCGVWCVCWGGGGVVSEGVRRGGGGDNL
jgi:hypothetical protein